MVNWFLFRFLNSRKLIGWGEAADLCEGVHAVCSNQDAVLSGHWLEGTAAISSVLQEGWWLHSVYQPLHLKENDKMRVSAAWRDKQTSWADLILHLRINHYSSWTHNYAWDMSFQWLPYYLPLFSHILLFLFLYNFICVSTCWPPCPGATHIITEASASGRVLMYLYTNLEKMRNNLWWIRLWLCLMIPIL